MAIVQIGSDGKSGSIQIEVDEVPRDDLQDFYGETSTRGLRENLVTKIARPLFEEAVDLACSCATQAKQKLDDMDARQRPHEFELQFAVNLDAMLGASIAQAKSGAQVQVRMLWNGNGDLRGGNA